MQFYKGDDIMVKKIKGIKIELIIISIVLFALGLFLVIYPELYVRLLE